MKPACDVDWSALAAWVQAVFSIVAIGIAVWLPKRDRKDQRKHQFEAQKAALVAISKRGQKTLDQLHTRAVKRIVPRAEFGWLRDEAEAIRDIADRVDLTTLLESSLVDAFVEVQEACRTGVRRLKQAINDARNDDGKITVDIPISEDKFDDPRERISKAIGDLQRAVQSER